MVLRRSQEKVSEYDGICIALAGGLSAIDIDHCVEDGKLYEMAEEIIDKVNSYTEDKDTDVSVDTGNDASNDDDSE